MQSQQFNAFNEFLPDTAYQRQLFPTTDHHFMLENKITHHKITPLWPQANAEAKTFMKPLKKCLQTATLKHKDWREELHKFLLNYHATPYCSTKVPPAVALYGQNIWTKLPQDPTAVNMDEKKKTTFN